MQIYIQHSTNGGAIHTVIGGIFDTTTHCGLIGIHRNASGSMNKMNIMQ